MATTKGRKSTRKKKEEEVEVPSVVEEVVETKVEEPVVESEPAPVLEQQVQEELPPPVEEPKVEEPPVPAPEPVQEAPVVEEVVETKVEEPVSQQKVLGIGSDVIIPSGKHAKVVGITKKGQFKVQRLDNPRKEYIYAPDRLTLLK